MTNAEKEFEFLLRIKGKSTPLIHRHMMIFANFDERELVKALEKAWFAEIDRQSRVIDVNP